MEMLHKMVDWYLNARKSMHTEDELLELAEQGFELQKYLIDNFPEKDGTKNVWNMFKHAGNRCKHVLTIFVQVPKLGGCFQIFMLSDTLSDWLSCMDAGR